MIEIKKKTRVIIFKLHFKEKERIQAAAKRQRKSMSEFILENAMQAARDQEEKDFIHSLHN